MKDFFDDVITKGCFLYLVNEFQKSNYTEDDFYSFYMPENIEDKEEFSNFFKAHNIYDYCTIIDGAYNTIKKLNCKYEIFIVTSYIICDIINDTGFLLDQKYKYLIKNFPFLDPNNIVFLGNKSVLNVDIKIDDRIDNLDGAKTKILFTAYHNKNISDETLEKEGIKRANSWYDIEKLLLIERNDLNE